MNYPKLSMQKSKTIQYLFCYKCFDGYQNDTLIQNPQCPECGVVMESMGKEALDNKIRIYETDRAQRKKALNAI